MTWSSPPGSMTYLRFRHTYSTNIDIQMIFYQKGCMDGLMIGIQISCFSNTPESKSTIRRRFVLQIWSLCRYVQNDSKSVNPWKMSALLFFPKRNQRLRMFFLFCWLESVQIKNSVAHAHVWGSEAVANDNSNYVFWYKQKHVRNTLWILLSSYPVLIWACWKYSHCLSREYWRSSYFPQKCDY